MQTYLKTRRSWFARWYISLIMDFQFRHKCNNSLDNQRDNVRPNLLDVHSFRCQTIQNARERAFTARAAAVRMDKVSAVHIKGIVGKVHKYMTEVLLTGFLVGFRAEPGQTIFSDVDF